MKLTTDEVVEGCVVDLACLRGYPRHDTLPRAREHSRQCLLSGHCIESGYALVSEDDRVIVLDPEATRQVVAVAQKSNNAKGIKLLVKRALRKGSMETFSLEETNRAPGGMGQP